MAIIDQDTVLILGAGVSAPFRLPLGGGMINDIRDSIQQELENIDRRENSLYTETPFSKILKFGQEQVSLFSKFPIHSTMMWRHASDYGEVSYLGESKMKVDADRAQIKKLEELLDNQTSETIDDFIVENPSYAQLTKICIAAQFMRSSYNFKNNLFNPKQFSTREFDGQRNWIHLLINIIRHGIRARTVSKENRVKIITFNYDKILEYVLEAQFSNTEASYPHYSNYIEIIHVHGECGKIDAPHKSNPSQICLEWARGIHVVNEREVPKDIENKRAIAQKIIQSAKELYFCGFSFSGPNCRLLKLDTPASQFPDRTITVCNYDGNVGISKSVERYENSVNSGVNVGRLTTHIEEEKGTPDSPLSVVDWIRSGRLGELPG